MSYKEFEVVIKVILAPFKWKEIFTAGVYSYQENSVTGDRRAIRIIKGGWSPLDTRWLGINSNSPFIKD